MPSRILRDKGVIEFVEAAHLMQKNRVSAIFRLLGDPDTANPTSLSLTEINKWVEEGVIEWHNYTTDINKALSEAHIVALPSYREGFPKTLIDAAAAGRVAVASDCARLPRCNCRRENGPVIHSKKFRRYSQSTYASHKK